jgi:hypothetical protein
MKRKQKFRQLVKQVDKWSQKNGNAELNDIIQKLYKELDDDEDNEGGAEAQDDESSNPGGKPPPPPGPGGKP